NIISSEPVDETAERAGSSQNLARKQTMHGFCMCGVHHHPTAVEHGSAIPRSGGETIATLVFTGKGVEWRERPKPRIQGAGEAIVRPIAASTCDLDHNILAGKTPFRGPFSIGHEAV